MRRPNFKGWVSRELLYLSGENTLNLRRLAFLAQGSAPRLWERLVLYAIITGQTTRLLSFLYRNEMAAEAAMLAEKLSPAELNSPDCAGSLNIPLQYKKVLLSYKAAYQYIETRNTSKNLRREKIIELQKKKGISTARICKALNLDPGNVNAFLNNAEIDRISLDKVSGIIRYLYSI